MTIKSKLTNIIMLVSGVAVFVSSVIFIISAFFIHQKAHVEKDLILEDLMGKNIISALMFDSPENAREILSSFEADSSIIFASVYKSDGELFAVYRKEGTEEIKTAPMKEEGIEYQDGYLKLARDIIYQGEKVGTIFLIDDQREVYAAIRWNIIAMVWVLLITLAISYFIANKSQNIISRPILSLAETAAKIRTTEDYSIRAKKHGRDEIGTLIDSFNGMLNEIQKREEAIAKSEEKFRSIVETTSDFIWETDSDHKYSYASPRLKDLLGYTPEEILGYSPFDLMAADESQRVKNLFLKGSAKREIFSGVENTCIHKDGREVVLETNAVPIIDEFGNYLGYRGIDRDITARKRAEEALKLDESRLQALVEFNQMSGASEEELVDFALNKAVDLTKSKIGYIGFVNEDETMLKIYSWSKTAVAECMVNTKPVNYLIEEMGLWGEAIRQRKPVVTNNYSEEDPYKRGLPKGHIAIIRHMNIPVFDSGKIVALAGVANKKQYYNDSDIRQLSLLMDGMWRMIQRNRIQKEKNELLRTLAAKNEELESIVYTASHDLRSPLVNIDGFSSELEASCKKIIPKIREQYCDSKTDPEMLEILDEDIPASLHYIRSSTKKMDVLMKALLKLSRLAVAAIDIVPLDMNTVIKNVVDSLRYQIKKIDADIEIEDLPPCLGDRTQIIQIFSNLIDNAVKYLDQSRKGVIKISGKVEGNESIYSVSDNGIGIAAELHGKIFEVFHRLDPTGTVDGDGIGLTIAKRMLDRNNGRIWLESNLDQGTTFYVALPAANENSKIPD